MAYSVEDDTYIALYAVWEDPADDEANVAWATERMREMEPLASGIQLADENLGRRPARFVSDENLARLDELRASVRPRRPLPSLDGAFVGGLAERVPRLDSAPELTPMSATASIFPTRASSKAAGAARRRAGGDARTCSASRTRRNAHRREGLSGLEALRTLRARAGPCLAKVGGGC